MVDPAEVRFELERLWVSEPGRLELTGRWFGIRGRRFVRPTLLVTVDGEDVERRLLAGLEHKPWSAEEGQAWTAAFPVDIGVRDLAAASIELSVTPDLTVMLRPRAASGRGGRLQAVADGARARERATGEKLVQRERAAGEKLVERERARRKDLIAGRDQAIAERDQAIALRDRVVSERDQAAAERDRAVRATARAESALQERETELESANRALREQRAELARLRAQVTPVASNSESRGRSETPTPERPRNPSLRRRANWFVRLLTVLVMLGVIAAIVLVVRMSGAH